MTIDYGKIKNLVDKYESRRKSGEVQRLSETDTRDDFITPLFRALGWNMENDLKRNDSVSKEENIAGRRSDYGFRINGIPQFFIEAKPIKEENILFGTGYDKQAVNYAWLKSCSWAILTNFSILAVYNADSGTPEWLFTHDAEDYLSDIGSEKMSNLSKSGFEKGLLDKWASENGKKPMKRPVDKQLLQDMTHFREILSRDIKKNNPRVQPEDIDEAVQRTLDRLVFIRNAEDREYEPKELKSNFRQWSRNESGHLVKKVRELYQHYREVYNSGLFGKDNNAIHISDQVEISNSALAEVIQGLYSPEGAIYSYDFSVLDTDVLGRIYEQYLGNLLRQTPKRAKLVESKTHRKEQGIYYTPSFVVDYIVKSTVGEYIKTHNSEEIRKVRILDPSCGSGSFLIRAYKELENYWKKELKFTDEDFKQTRFDSENTEQVYTLKTDILRNNIFGVDLDPKAVEIAQLNLLLQISEKRHKLPLLHANIKIGDSLIDDPRVSKSPFNWEDEFPDIMKNGGFDIVIGNPPWVFTRGEHFTESQKEYFSEFLKAKSITQLKKGRNIQSGKLNLYALFLVKAIEISKNKGFVSFIVPNNILRTTVYDTTRGHLLTSTTVLGIADLSSGIFDNVTASSIIIAMRKESDKNTRDNNLVRVEYDFTNFRETNARVNKVPQKNFLENTSYAFDITVNSNELQLRKKVESESVELGLISKYIIEGIVGSLDRDVSGRKENEKYKKFLIGKDIGRYTLRFRGRYINYDRRTLHRARPEEVFLSNKIITQRISGGSWPIKATYDDEQFYTFASINNIILKEDCGYLPEYVLGILNSKLLNWYYSKSYTNGSDLTVNVSKTFLEKLPIRKAELEIQRTLSTLVKELLAANVKAVKMGDSETDTKHRMEQEIGKIDIKIDSVVYDLYGLNEGEREIVENEFR